MKNGKMNFFEAYLNKITDEKWLGTILYNDLDKKLPITKIWLNAIGKARKSGVSVKKHEPIFQLIVLFYVIWGKIKFTFSKEVILSDDYNTYWKKE